MCTIFENIQYCAIAERLKRNGEQSREMFLVLQTFKIYMHGRKNSSAYRARYLRLTKMPIDGLQRVLLLIIIPVFRNKKDILVLSYTFFDFLNKVFKNGF